MTTTVRIPALIVEAASVVEGDWCGHDVLRHIVAWLRELAHLVLDLATDSYQRGEPCDPWPDWSAWNAARIAPHRTARPEAGVAGVVTAPARLLEVVEGLDEATHEPEHAARLAAHACRPARPRDPPCHQPGPVLHTSHV